MVDADPCLRVGLVQYETRTRGGDSMRGIMCVLGSVLIAGLAAPISAGDDATYDLRGPAPQKGQTITTKMVVRIKDADMQVKLGGQNLTLKQTLVATTEEEEKFLAIDGR